MVIIQETNPSFRWVVFVAWWERLRCSHEKWIKNQTETVHLEFFSCQIWAVAVEKSKGAMAFS